MVINNAYNLPDSLVRAVSLNDRPKFGPKTISVTTLIRPPQMRALEKIHEAEIVEDVSDKLWILLGRAVHKVLEMAADKEAGDVPEERITAELDGWTISGQRDLIERDGTIIDWKCVSVYSFLLGTKDEWVQQLNILRWIAEKNGQSVPSIKIHAILRDHQKSKVSPDEPDYPPIPFINVDVEMWPMEKTEAFIRDRLAAHEKSLIDPNAVPCTPEERWERAGKFAVIRKGQKRSMRNLDTKEEAEIYIKNTGLDTLSIEERPTLQRRCESFCAVLPWCVQAKSLGVVKR